MTMRSHAVKMKWARPAGLGIVLAGLVCAGVLVARGAGSGADGGATEV